MNRKAVDKMASTYRRSRSYPIPDGAEIVERKRKATSAELKKHPEQKHVVERFAKWREGKGRNRRERLNDAGEKIIVPSGSYLIDYWDENGKKQTVNSGTSDRDAAEQIAGQLETEVALRKRGIINTAQERFANEVRRPLAEHIEDFRGYLSAKGNTRDHVHRTCQNIEWIAETCHAKKIGDLTGTGVLGAVDELRDADASLRTCNAYLRSIKSFTRWDLAELLRPWLAGFRRDHQLFPLPHNTAKMFRRDLDAARSAWIDAADSDVEREQRESSDFLLYQDADGQVIDFHAQRHTYISDIVASGASVKTAQELARHSDPRLTIGRYSHARLHDLKGAIEGLPSLNPEKPKQQAQQATGTEGLSPANRQQLSGKTGQKTASDGESDGCQETEDARRKVLSLNTFGERGRESAKVVRGRVELPTPGFSVQCSTN